MTGSEACQEGGTFGAGCRGQCWASGARRELGLLTGGPCGCWFRGAHAAVLAVPTLLRASCTGSGASWLGLGLPLSHLDTADSQTPSQMQSRCRAGPRVCTGGRTDRAVFSPTVTVSVLGQPPCSGAPGRPRYLLGLFLTNAHSEPPERPGNIRGVRSWAQSAGVPDWG